MVSRVKKISEFTLTTAGVAVLWILLYRLNMWGYKPNQMPFISWVFIPSGFKLFVSLILRLNCIPGLFLGALYLTYHYHPELLAHDQVILALICSVTGIVACLVMERILKRQLLSYVLGVQEFLWLALVYAISNSLIHLIFFYLHHDLIAIRLIEPFKMFVGDFLGVAIFMAALNCAHFMFKKLKCI